MRAAAMKERPSFPLMRQTDVQCRCHAGCFQTHDTLA
jgi:hypothetical protein